MSSSTSTDRIERFFHHLATLKGYAQKILVDGDSLSGDEEGDRTLRMAEFFEIGGSFDLSDKEMITILFREMFGTR